MKKKDKSPLYKIFLRERLQATILKDNIKVNKSKSNNDKKDDNRNVNNQEKPSLRVSIPVKPYYDPKVKIINNKSLNTMFKIPKINSTERSTTSKLRTIRCPGNNKRPADILLQNTNASEIEPETLQLITNINIDDIEMPEEDNEKDNSIEKKVTLASTSAQTEEVHIIGKEEMETLHIVKNSRVNKTDLENMLNRYEKHLEETIIDLGNYTTNSNKGDNTKDVIYKVALELSEKNKKALRSEMKRIQNLNSEIPLIPPRACSSSPFQATSESTPNTTQVFVPVPVPAFTKTSSPFQQAMLGTWLEKMTAQDQCTRDITKSNKEVQTNTPTDPNTDSNLTQTDDDETNKRRKSTSPSDCLNEINTSILSIRTESPQNNNYQFEHNYQPVLANRQKEQLQNLSENLQHLPLPPSMLPSPVKSCQQKTLTMPIKPIGSPQLHEEQSRSNFFLKMLQKHHMANNTLLQMTQCEQLQFQESQEMQQQLIEPEGEQLPSHMPPQHQQIQKIPNTQSKNIYAVTNRSVNTKPSTGIQFHHRDPRRLSSQALNMGLAPAPTEKTAPATNQSPVSASGVRSTTVSNLRPTLTSNVWPVPSAGARPVPSCMIPAPVSNMWSASVSNSRSTFSREMLPPASSGWPMPTLAAGPANVRPTMFTASITPTPTSNMRPSVPIMTQSRVFSTYEADYQTAQNCVMTRPQNLYYRRTHQNCWSNRNHYW